MAEYTFRDFTRHWKAHCVQSDWDYYDGLDFDSYLEKAQEFANQPIDDKKCWGWYNENDGNIIKLRLRELASIRKYKYEFIMYNDDKGLIYSMYPVARMPLKQEVMDEYNKLPIDEAETEQLESLLHKFW